MLFTWFLLDVYMVKVAPYWSQKYGIAAYYKHRRSPEEKLVAYQMYWRGETFYTKNEIYEGAHGGPHGLRHGRRRREAAGAG